MNNITIPGPEMSYIDILDDAIMEKQKKEAEAPSDRFPLRPSSSGNCERELAYQLMEFTGKAKYEKEMMSPSTVRLLSLGHSIEFHIINILKQCSLFRVRYQQQALDWSRVESDDENLARMIEGSNDLCIFSDQHGWRGVWDVKSKGDKFSATHKSKFDEDGAKYDNMKSLIKLGENAYYADDLEAFLEELNDPFFAANFLQLNLYACSDFMKKRGVDHGVILQYLKNDSRLREVRFRPSEKLCRQVQAKFNAAAKAVEKGDPTLAEQTFLAGSVKCAFCNYAKECRGNTDTKKEFFKTLPDKYFPKDSSRIEDKQLVAQLEEYDALYEADKKRIDLEKRIAQKMVQQRLFKVKLSNQKVYEVKQHKTTTSVKRGKV